MCCIVETLVRRDRSGKWSEHGKRARVMYNLETLETKEPKTDLDPQQRSTWFQQRNLDQRNSLRTTKPRIVPRTTNTMLGLMQYPQRVTENTANVPRNSQICGSSATYRSTVPLFKSSNQMFYATQSILRPLSHVPTSRIELIVTPSIAQDNIVRIVLFSRRGSHCSARGGLAVEGTSWTRNCRNFLCRLLLSYGFVGIIAQRG